MGELVNGLGFYALLFCLVGIVTLWIPALVLLLVDRKRQAVKLALAWGSCFVLAIVIGLASMIFSYFTGGPAPVPTV